MNGRNGNGNGKSKGTIKARLQRLEAELGDPASLSGRVNRRIVSILNGRTLPATHRQALTKAMREQARPIRERARTAEDDAAVESLEKAVDGMTDPELRRWFEREAKAAWDELDDSGRAAIAAGLEAVAQMQRVDDYQPESTSPN